MNKISVHDESTDRTRKNRSDIYEDNVMRAWTEAQKVDTSEQTSSEQNNCRKSNATYSGYKDNWSMQSNKGIERLSATLSGLSVRGTTQVLRKIKAAPHSKSPDDLEIVGIDDWAYRRGQRYGTIVCDLKRHCVVDVLTDRTATTVATWLKEHPTIKVVSRDRSGSYEDAIRQGLPNATQVADRWHLLKNLGDAVERYFQDTAYHLARKSYQNPSLNSRHVLKNPVQRKNKNVLTLTVVKPNLDSYKLCTLYKKQVWVFGLSQQRSELVARLYGST